MPLPAVPAPATLDAAPDRPARRRALLIGTPQTIRSARDQLALLDEAPEPIGCILIGRQAARALGGLPVFGDLDALPAAAALHEPALAIVSLPGAMADAITRVRSVLRRCGVEERFIPTLHDLLSQSPPLAVGLGAGAVAGIGSAPRLDLAGLVGRAPHPIDSGAVAGILAGKRVLITGAGGSIGSELARIAAGFDPEQVQLVERSENALFEIDSQLARRHPRSRRRAVLHDVADRAQTLALLRDLRPHVVFHAAAHKHVPLMEDHPAHAVTNNLLGTRSIADAALQSGAERFVFVSTDKAVNPSSVMGATKRLAELYIHWLSARAVGPGGMRFGMVRFGNVLGSACSVLTIWSAQIAEGGPVTVTDPRMTRYFMTIPEAAALVIQAAAVEEDPGRGGAAMHVLDMGRPIRILDLCERFIRAHALEPRIQGRPAQTPGPLPSIDVLFTGIRPGEKLDEELWYASEPLHPTRFPGINVWTGAPRPFDCPAAMADLSGLGPHAPREAVLAAIRRHLPEMAGPLDAAAPGRENHGR